MIKVLCHGCFDIIHAGHLAYFEEAKKYGDHLTVSITSDRFVNKGPGRPYFSHDQRAKMVKALAIVDEVVISDEATAAGVIRRLRPDFYAKGPDYKDLTKDVTGEIINEKKAVEEHGGKLVFTNQETHSSSAIINKFFSNFSDEQKAQIQAVQNCGGLGAIKHALQEIEKLKVLVIGESILDVYRFCNPESISSKSPSISARFQFEEEYQGGSDAIFNHLRDFVVAQIMWPLNKALSGRNLARKVRYISSDKQQRIFEVTHIDESDWAYDSNVTLLQSYAKNQDVIVAADFGHGLFEGPMLEAMKDIKAFIGLNVQTNSSNFGFNVYTKHKRFDYLCLDTREARLAEHDRYSSPHDIARRIHRHQTAMSLTLGPNGSYLFDGDHEYKCPAFSDVVIDATGAGDAYFAITTCLIKSGCSPTLIPFIGNVFAGLKTKIIGNKSSVSKASLLKACEAILK